MKLVSSTRTLTIPDDAKVKIKSRHIIVEGPRGRLERNLRHINADVYKVYDDDSGKYKVKVDLWYAKGKSLAILRTVTTTIHNMILGALPSKEAGFFSTPLFSRLVV